ncbi:hypothetical protein M9H77_01315 [Catharanthus roseus]|uniref:Uncharacterized protein n=1 Tax=Catharanthus roseus TaxID=4058 RepID=A0ACC0C5M0_CATRO|nr:hypothetical protein M9H77_01315 [Catharanthus roseus]
MDKLDKLKLASSSFGERLKTGGAQMSRMVSTKMKEILQAPTPESKMVDEATLETMEEPNWGLNLRICAMINTEELNGTEVVKAIKKKLLGKSQQSQRLVLDLLETCTSNCEKVFSEVASEKVLDDMMKMIDDLKTDQENRVKAIQLIRAWGESEDLMYLPVFQQTYMNLKTRAIHPVMQHRDRPPMQYPLETYINEDLLSPPERYPMPEMGMNNAENTISISYGGQSVEEKREFLVVTRNSLDILSSILNSKDELKPMKNELTVSLYDKCKESQPVVKGIIESTTGDEGMLFEALSLHDELQLVISKCEEMEAALESGGMIEKQSDAGELQSEGSDNKEAKPSTQLENPAQSARIDPSKAVNANSNSESPEVKEGIRGKEA